MSSIAIHTCKHTGINENTQCRVGACPHRKTRLLLVREPSISDLRQLTEGEKTWEYHIFGISVIYAHSLILFWVLHFEL